MKYYCSCPECGDDLDIDKAVDEELDSPYLSEEKVATIGDEFCVEVVCTKCKDTVTIDCEVALEFSANIY